MSDQQTDNSTQNIAQAIQEVSERASMLVREEIELAKVEVTEKITKRHGRQLLCHKEDCDYVRSEELAPA